jgi:hypothetical protein
MWLISNIIKVSKSAFLFIGLLIGVIVSSLVYFALKTDTRKPTNAEQVKQMDTVFVKADTVIQEQKVFEAIEIVSPDTVMVYTQFKLNEPVAALPDTNEYVVLRDKILASKTVPILNSNLHQSKDASDVLAQKMSNDQWFGETINVEFWESPIGYEGYRLNKTKLILFGVNPLDELSLTYIKQGYLLLHLGAFKTKLYPTENFLTFGN